MTCANWWLRTLFLGFLALAIVPQALQAEAPACGPKPANPCLNPVQAGTGKTISGYATNPSSTVRIEVNKTDKGQAPVKADGSFQFDLSSLNKGDTITATETASAPGAAALAPATQTVAAPTPTASGTSSSLFTLGLAGINATGTSTSGPSQQYFASFDVTAPVPFLGPLCPEATKPDYPLSQKCWVWMNPRISSAPAPANTSLSSFTSPSSLTSGISGQTLGQIAQTFEIQGGFEYSFVEPYKGRQFGWKSTWARISPSAILGFGATTPLSSTTSANEFDLNTNLASQFNNTPAFATTYPILATALCAYGYVSKTCPASPPTYKHVAFVLPNRSRFYRDYFAGFRLRTFFFSGDCKDALTNQSGEKASSTCKIQNNYPGTFDVRFGQDETVTGGYLRSVVITINGTYPIPGTSGVLYLFGSTFLRLHSNNNTPTLALLTTSAANAVPITDPSVVIQPIRQSDQDYYRLGIGADLISLISKWVAKSNSSTNTGN